MKKIMPAFICLLLLTTCGFEMPESITVKGNPGLYVPLGSPFAGKDKDGKDKLNLTDYISPANIKNMMNDQTKNAGMGDELKIYEVDKELTAALELDPEVQTYLVRYPLAEMPLDLEQYAKDAMAAVNKKEQFTIPSIPPETFLISPFIYLTEDGPEGTDNNKPFIKIPLKDMVKLVKWVEAESDGKCKFGLEIDYSPELASSLELKIPGFDINNFMPGIPTDDNGNPTSSPTKLRYYRADPPLKTKFYPRDQRDTLDTPVTDFSDLIDSNLLIYARISAPFQQQILTPRMIFDWKKAMIDTITGTEGSFTGTYPITSNLSEFLGKGVSFKRVEGYMYMSANELHTKDTKMSIGIYNDSGGTLFATNPPLILHDVAPPVFPDGGNKFTKAYGDLLLNDDKMSLDNPIDMNKLLDEDSASLKVAISIEQMEISKAGLQDKNRTHIKFDLLVLIPLDLEVTKQIPAEIKVDPDIRGNYVMLDLGDAFPKDKGNGDLFGREPGEDNALKRIKYVKIGLKYSKSDINIINPSNLAVLVTAGTESRLLEFKNNGASLTLPGTFIGNPFNPTFTVLLKKDDGEDFGSFQILRPAKPSFDFRLYVEAKAALEYTLDL